MNYLNVYRLFDYFHRDNNMKDLLHCIERDVRYCKITRNVVNMSSETQLRIIPKCFP